MNNKLVNGVKKRAILEESQRRYLTKVHRAEVEWFQRTLNINGVSIMHSKMLYGSVTF